jgi:glucose 1-dehydrogenase
MKGMVALVTGGGRGIGRGIALELGRRGADVAIGYRSEATTASAVTERLLDLGVRSVALAADIRDPSTAERLVHETVAQLGRLDVLISNAGSLVNASFLETTLQEYDLQQETNARGSFFVAQAAAKQMIAQKAGGRIIFITSEAAMRATRGLSAYCMSKASQKMLAETAAIELAPYGITVNAVAPGTTETDMNRAMLADPEMRSILTSSILLGRPGTPGDIAPAVAFLASEEANFITGCTIAVDGGSSIN